MRRTLWPVSVVLVAFAASAVGIGRVAAQQTAPGAAACTALDAAMFTAVATLATTYDVGSAAQPAHCVVRGSAAPRTGVDGKVYETRFELRLPTDWSGRFLYQGGGGNDGIVAPAVGRNTGSFPDTGLQRGFAVVTTDAGHQGATAEFGLDPVARVEHAYTAHERTATIAFAIVARYYGRAPNRRYFMGCSGGGRQGMMFAQRYPAYFDGIAICAPAMSVSSGATIAAAWDTQTYLSIAPSNDEGQRVLSRAFSDADLALVARGITEACDAADGAVDGMVLRPEACRFDPKRLQCAGAKDATCLTPEQIAALERTFRGPRDSAGRALYAGQPWDPGVATPGWRQWKLGTSPTNTPNAVNATLMAGALAYEFFTPPDPLFSIARFDFDRDPARMEAFSAVYDTHRDAALAEYRRRGGKLLIFHGTADPIFSALESIDYYQRLTRNNGGPEATAAWARLFLVPGMNHCAGGPATDSFDGLGAIVDWVEKGAAPARIEASALPGNSYFPRRTRPLCPYPSYARYTGTGSLEDGVSFACATDPATAGIGDAPAAARVTVARREALLRQVAASVSATRARPPGAAQLAPPPTPLTTSRAWNAAERIALWPAAPPNGTFVPATLPAGWPAPFVANVASPELRVFPAQQPNGQAVLVIPGGGYQFVSVENEGADFAARLNARGYTVFVLVYRLPSEGWQRGEDVPLQDAQRAMRVIRANAARWKIDVRTLAVVGFSAGGHLAATLSTGFAEPVYVPVDGADAASARPFAAALIYPVVTMAVPGTHPTSRELLLGPNPLPSQVARRSAELHVGAETPPLLLVHAIDDTAVPVSNSLNLLTAMRGANRPVEAHLFQEGGHAFASGYPNSPTSSWIAVFDAWLARLRASS